MRFPHRIPVVNPGNRYRGSHLSNRERFHSRPWSAAEFGAVLSCTGADLSDGESAGCLQVLSIGVRRRKTEKGIIKAGAGVAPAFDYVVSCFYLLLKAIVGLGFKI